ncbi:hypothetical protein GH714_043747 [Hevea brasiliensis]|uniref:Glycerol-3-phosphate acyltransferase RAM2/GPAT1-8 HAD-like domain-containing protein n=1 Tax=Hevea brasiliensis TaxID=3981 RepID=A0A6A6K580_HEVBR|nr:hypothetical protein GH714_043747 [Hevea brasiliensis]
MEKQSNLASSFENLGVIHCLIAMVLSFKQPISVAFASLLRMSPGRSSFPYFALIAFEGCGVLRLLFLLLASPLAGLLYYFVSESAGIQVLIFASFAGMKVSDIESVACVVLPKFYSGDLHPESACVLFCVWKRCVLTARDWHIEIPFMRLGLEIGILKFPSWLCARSNCAGGYGESDELVPWNNGQRLERMDPFYFFMNPSPAYEVTFLSKLPHELTCSSGKASHEMANYIQRVIAATLSIIHYIYWERQVQGTCWERWNCG